MCISDQNNELQKSKEDIEDGSPKRKMVSSIALNIPAAGLGSRPASIVSTSTLDEGGFNEPSPEIKAKLRPHEDTLFNFPVAESGITQQKSIDSDVMYHFQPSVITNSVLAELECQESEELKNYKETNSEFLRHERNYENENKSVLEPLFIQTSNKSSVQDQSFINKKSDSDLLLSKYDKNVQESDKCETSKVESEPFLVSRTVLPSENLLNLTHTESPKSEASILDLQDVEYADASDEEDLNKVNNKSTAEAETMTQAEAENLLSSRYVLYKSNQ